MSVSAMNSSTGGVAWRTRSSPDDRGGEEDSRSGEHRRQVLAVQPLHERMKHFTRATVVAVVAIQTVDRKRRQRIDEHSPRADARRFGEQQAVGLLKLLLQHRPRRENDLDLALTFEVRQVPPELRSVADHLDRRNLEQHDEARLAELGGAPVDELDPQRRLATAGPSFDDDHVAAWNPATENRIESDDAGLDRI